jgi:hypothetical protein
MSCVLDMENEWVILAKYLESFSNFLSNYGLSLIHLLNLINATETYFVWLQVTDQNLLLYYGQYLRLVTVPYELK